MTTLTIANKIIEDNLEAENMSVKKIRALMTIADVPNKIADKAIKDKGLVTKRVSFADTFYTWLVEGERTEQEVIDMLEATESENVYKANRKHYLNIWTLTNAVRAKATADS